MEKEFFKTYLDVDFKKRDTGSFLKAISSYGSDEPTAVQEYVTSPNKLLEKQLDLFYGLSILVSEGVNKNSDTFLRDILIGARNTPLHKFVDWEHDVHGENKKVNPEKYQVIGHIYDSTLAAQDGSYIPEYDVFKDLDGKWFSKDSSWRDKPLDIVVAWVIYKFEFPEIIDAILRLESEKPGSFGVSMEILFSDYKFRIGGGVSPTEDFDFDANTMGIREVRKGDALADMFQKEWNEGKYRTWNGLPVVRILGGTVLFSGMAITANRANKRSWNISFAKDMIKEFKDPDLIKLVEAVAKKSGMDMSTCNLINGEPDCECVEKTIAMELETLEANLNEISKKLPKLDGEKLKFHNVSKAGLLDCPYCEEEKDLDVFSDEHIIYHSNDLENNLVRAQKKIEDLYKNNLDGDLSQEELMEEVEEIYSILESSQAEVDLIRK